MASLTHPRADARQYRVTPRDFWRLYRALTPYWLDPAPAWPEP